MPSDRQERPAAKRQEWETRQLMIGYPTSEKDWTPIASPAHLIRGKDVLEHAQRHFDARGEHYLLVRIHLGDTRVTSRPVLDDETMADLPVTGNVVSMRLVRLLV